MEGEPAVQLIPKVRVYVRHEGGSESSLSPAGYLYEPQLRDMYRVFRVFMPTLTAIEITMDCDIEALPEPRVEQS